MFMFLRRRSIDAERQSPMVIVAVARSPKDLRGQKCTRATPFFLTCNKRHRQQRQQTGDDRARLLGQLL